jgi:hypothetical protein
MKDNLTHAEKTLLSRLESAGKWDHLLHNLSLLTPSFIIMGLGIHFDSSITIFTGMILCAAFALRTSLHQAKMVPVMKSLLKKLTQNEESPTKHWTGIA